MARVLSRPGGIVVASASALLLWALSVHSQSELLVGYATIEGAGNSALPVATALFALRNVRPAPISSPSGIGISLSPTSVQEGSSPLRSSSSIQLPGSLWERSNSRDPMAFRSPLSSMAPKDRAGQPGQPLDRRL